MSDLDPVKLTLGDLCKDALAESGVFGIGQTPQAEDINYAWSRIQFLIQQWQMQRWMVYHLQELNFVSTGALEYTVGPGGNFDPQKQFNARFNDQFGTAGEGPAPNSLVSRPDAVEAAFVRQNNSGNPPVDFPLQVLPSKEDYFRIALKSLVGFPRYVYYDPQWPLGVLKVYPVPQNGLYELFLAVKASLPSSFKSLATTVILPYPYFAAILYNGALRVRPKYGKGTFPGDQVPLLAAQSLKVIRNMNAQIPKLLMPRQLKRDRIYNIFSDQTY